MPDKTLDTAPVPTAPGRPADFSGGPVEVYRSDAGTAGVFADPLPEVIAAPAPPADPDLMRMPSSGLGATPAHVSPSRPAAAPAAPATVVVTPRAGDSTVIVAPGAVIEETVIETPGGLPDYIGAPAVRPLPGAAEEGPVVIVR